MVEHSTAQNLRKRNECELGLGSRPSCLDLSMFCGVTACRRRSVRLRVPSLSDTIDAVLSSPCNHPFNFATVSTLPVISHYPSFALRKRSLSLSSTIRLSLLRARSSALSQQFCSQHKLQRCLPSLSIRCRYSVASHHIASCI